MNPRYLMQEGSEKKTKVYLDFETRSELDLRKVGAVKYACHPSTQAYVCRYKVNGRRYRWRPDCEPMSKLLRAILARDEDFTIVAHNAFFEYCIFKFCIRVPVIISQFNCTASRAAAMALPRNLEGVGAVLGLPIQKDMDGNRLMKKWMKPRRAWKSWDESGRQGREPAKWWCDDFEFMAIDEYCATDVDVCELIDSKLPELVPFERELWLINQKMNERGINIDVPTVKKVLKYHNEEVSRLQAMASALSNGAFTSVLQRDAVLKFLATQGVYLSDLRIGTVEEALKNKLPVKAKRVLQIRTRLSKSSVKKYQAMVDRAIGDRVCDLTLYHGAATGRDAGRGLQVHNFPRGTIKNTDYAIEEIIKSEHYEDLELLFGDTSRVYSSCLRGMITASPGYTLMAADLNAIECRVLNWVAGQDDAIRDFREGVDRYKVMAAWIFNKDILDIDDAERFLGKTAVLGCGYQMGWAKFYATCVNYGVPNITEELAKKAVTAFRRHHAKVVLFWAQAEEAAIKAVKRKTTVPCGRVSFQSNGRHLKIKLPSGRNLSMPFCELRNEPTPWGEYLPKLYYQRTDSQTRKWVTRATYGGSIVESICQGIARDVTMNGVYELDKAGYNYLFQVHDEAVFETMDKPNVEKFIKILTKPAPWFADLPIKAGGFANHRYKK